MNHTEYDSATVLGVFLSLGFEEYVTNKQVYLLIHSKLDGKEHGREVFVDRSAIDGEVIEWQLENIGLHPAFFDSLYDRMYQGQA